VWINKLADSSGGGGGQRKKDLKIAKKRPKIALLSLYLLLFVPCLKIQGGYGPPLPPAADAHARIELFQHPNMPNAI